MPLGSLTWKVGNMEEDVPLKGGVPLPGEPEIFIGRAIKSLQHAVRTTDGDLSSFLWVRVHQKEIQLA